MDISIVFNRTSGAISHLMGRYWHADMQALKNDPKIKFLYI